MKKLILPLMIAALVISCNTKTANTDQIAETEPVHDPYENIIPELRDCLEAHGGIELWRSFASLEYTRVASNGSGDNSIIDLWTRKDIVKNDSLYTIGFDGKDVWIVSDKEAINSPRFFHNLYFYFFAFPFVVADPGTNAEFLGVVNFDKKNYKKIKITYGDNVGDSPEDQYILWINAESSLLEFINYSVTYFDTSRAESYNALVYGEWQDIQGLKVPSVMTSYRWSEDSLGEKRGSNTFTNVKFGKKQPNQNVFEVPEGALIDELPQTP